MEHFGLPTCSCHTKQDQCCDICQIWLPAIARHEKEIDNLLALLRCHTRHWQVIGEAFGLCMGGVDGDVTDLHGNASLIIEHCLNVAERAKKDTAAKIITMIRECNSSMSHRDIIDEINELFNSAIQPCCGHDSDCAVHNAPAFEPGMCNCGKHSY